MKPLKITSGSEKQNIWATDIANKILLPFSRKIEELEARDDGSDFSLIISALKLARLSVRRDIEKLSASEIIEIRGRNMSHLIPHLCQKSKEELTAIVANAKKQLRV